MNTKTKPLSAEMLILCLAGELSVDPSFLVEAIQEDQDCRRVIRSYAQGDFTFEQVLDTVKDIF